MTYGVDIDARTYLQKFYNLIIQLPGAGEYDHKQLSRRFIAYLKQPLSLDSNALGFVEAAVRARDLSLREIEKITIYMSLAIAFTTSKTQTYFRPSPILAGLCILKVIEPQLFQKAKSSQLSMEDAFYAFQFSKWNENSVRTWAIKWWQYALDKNLDLNNPEWRDFASNMGGYFNVDRQDFVRFVAEGVIDRFQIPRK